MDRRYKKKMEHYFDKMYSKALSQVHNLNIEGWFDYWHTHLDWKSKGNRNIETKSWVAHLTYDLLKEVELYTGSQKSRLQVWAMIFENTGNNAVFIHSENDNNTPFPNDFEGVSWGVEEPPELIGVIERSEHELGRKDYGGEVMYYIRNKEKYCH